MPNRPVFTGQRAECLAQKGPEYAKARENGTHKDVVASVQHQFLLRWPIGSEEVNLTEDQLKSIDNDAPLPERPHPKERKDEFKTDEEYEDAEKAWKQYNKDVSTRKRQIEERLKSDYNKEHAPAMKKGDKHPFTPLLDQLSYGKKHAQKGKPRKQAAEEAWAEANKSYFDAIREKRKQEEASKPSGLPAPAIRNSVLREEFGKLSEEEQKDWEEGTQKKHAEALKEWTERKKQTEKPSEKPEDLQACIDRLNEFCMPILDGIAERTGWCCSLLLGGPEPRDGGRLNMVALHAGKPTSGPVKMQFGRSEVQAWRSSIFLAFSRHLKKVYTMEECRARALPSDYKPDEGIQADGEEVLRWREPDNDVQAQPGEANEKEKEGQSKERNGEVEKSKSDNLAKGASKGSKKPGAGKGKAKGASRRKRQEGKSSKVVDEELVDDEDEDEDEDDVSNITVTRSSPPRTRGSARQSAPSQSAPPASSAPSASSVTPSSPLRDVESRQTPCSPVNPSQSPFTLPEVSPAPDHSRISPIPPSSVTHTPLRRSTSPVTHRNGTPSPDPITSDRMPSLVPNPSERRETTPSPAPSRTPSPLPVNGRPSITRKAGKSQPQAVVSKRRQTSSAPATGQKRTHEDEPDSEASSKRARVEESSKSSSAGPHTLPELPEGVSEDPKFYARQALALFRREEVIELKGWKSLVHSWFEHERQGDFDGTNSRGKLGTQGRPKWVGSWVARARNPEYRSKDPEDYKGSKFLTEWWSWWGSLQPKWRSFNQAKRPRASSEYTEGSWDNLRVSGPNGLTSVVAPLVHAASILAASPSGGTGRDKKAREQVQEDLEEAVDDVAFVLGRLLATSND